jgi:hypothetical protein
MWRGRPRARAFPMNNGRGRPFHNPASGENIAISLASEAAPQVGGGVGWVKRPRFCAR